MALENVKADGNVPFIGPRGRFQLTGIEPAWIFQTMFAGVNFDKKLAITASETAPEVQPEVVGGKAEFKDLTEGGVFDTIATAKKAHIIEEILNGGSATLDIVRLEDLKATSPIEDTPTFRVVPGSFPFKMAPGETIRADAGANGGSVGLLIREDAGSIAG